MTPTPPDRPAHRHHRRGGPGAAQPTCASRGRHRAPTYASTRGRAHAPHLAGVWPFADAEPLSGVTLLAGWLGRVIITLVTGYTRPGDRVLLVPPPAPPRTRWSTPGRAPTADPYAGLAEAVWTITRLGRTACTTPVRQHEPSPADPPVPRALQSGFGPGPGPRVVHTSTESDVESDARPPRPGARFDLVITAVHPHAVDWFVRTDWDPVFTPTGALAVVTHSDSRGGRLTDPVSAIVTTVRSRQRGWLDHIAVLTHPLKTADAAVWPNSLPPRRAGGKPAFDPPPVRAVHHDLLLFGPVPSLVSTPASADGTSPIKGETSDD